MARSAWALADDKIVEKMSEISEPDVKNLIFLIMKALSLEDFVKV
jgi:hypothetical protein